MLKKLKSPAEARHREVRGDLVIDLYLRCGSVWREIERFRERWAITPTEIVPPPLPAGVSSMTPSVYRPLPWPDRLQSRYDPRVEDIHLDAMIPEPWLWSRPDWQWRVPYRHCDWDLHCRVAWWYDLADIHDAVVPPDAQREGRVGLLRAAQWMPFLSACLVCDPPPAELLAFRDAPAMVYDLPPHQSYSADVSELPDDTPVMFAAPIAPPEELASHKVAIFGASAQEMAQAAKLLMAHPRSGRTKRRDRLTAVQCAVWRDHCGWSHRKIAQQMRWRLRKDEFGSQRISDRVQDHIKEGRAVIDSVRK